MADPFKAYDIRGIYPYEVNESLAYHLGKAFATFNSGKNLVVARDGRESGDKLYTALIKGIISTGTNVIAIGKVSTPQFYFSLYSGTADGGIIVTASHNPKEYNGFKLCSHNAMPVYKENGLLEIKKIIQKQHYKQNKQEGHIIKKEIGEEYVKEFKKLSKPLKKEFKILIDCGNGMGILETKTLKKIYGDKLAIQVLYPKIDGNFPNHECNPSVKENLDSIIKVIKLEDYDFGVAFDGDADRVVFITNDGTIIPSDLMTGIIGSYILKKGEKAGYEVRSSRAVSELFSKREIKSYLYPSGHAYIKEHMRNDGTRFAGEKSGHYFYQSLHYTDSSLFTIMNMLALLDEHDDSLGMIAKPLIEKYSNSGELNYEVSNPDIAINKVKEEFQEQASKILEVDGVSIYTNNYFFNIRKSNTEPLVRVNIEGNSIDEVEKIKKTIELIISRT